MGEIKAVFTFELANETTHKITVKDLADNLEESKLIALGNKMITLGGEHNGSKYVKLNKCQRIVTNTEDLL